MINNEELRKKIIDFYDSKLKDIFTEDEVLAILDALKPSILTTPGVWPTTPIYKADSTIDINN